MSTIRLFSKNYWLSDIAARPPLCREEESRLALLYRKTSDREAAKTLVLANVRFVITLAQSVGVRYQMVALPDLVQEGIVGLMQAVKRFDPCKGCRLITFAKRWIYGRMVRYIKSLSLEWEVDRALPVESLVDERQSLPAEDAMFRDESSKMLAKALSSLSEREKDIVQSRWLLEGEKAPLRTLALRHNVSMERVRQIEKEAMQRMKIAMEGVYCEHKGGC